MPSRLKLLSSCADFTLLVAKSSKNIKNLRVFKSLSGGKNETSRLNEAIQSNGNNSKTNNIRSNSSTASIWGRMSVKLNGRETQSNTEMRSKRFHSKQVAPGYVKTKGQFIYTNAIVDNMLHEKWQKYIESNKEGLSKSAKAEAPQYAELLSMNCSTDNTEKTKNNDESGKGQAGSTEKDEETLGWMGSIVESIKLLRKQWIGLRDFWQDHCEKNGRY